jgi:hypothetical protein
LYIFYASGFPGIIFYGSPNRYSITSKEATIKSSDTGLSLFIPEQSLDLDTDVRLVTPLDTDVKVTIHSCFNGPFELPDGYEPASPAYHIQMSRKVHLQISATLEIHHYARLQSEEDCAGMAFLSASATPQYRQFKPVYVFKKVEGSKGIFKPWSQIGTIAIQHFCNMMIARQSHLGK